MPLVWLSNMRMVIEPPFGTIPGSQLSIVSPSVSVPSPTSCRAITAIAVLVMLPTRAWSVGRSAISGSSWADPTASRVTSSPSSIIALTPVAPASTVACIAASRAVGDAAAAR